MRKSPVNCTGDPDTCETCISIREFAERLKRNKAEIASTPILMRMIEGDGLLNDEQKTSK
ncbi:MAG: hypothetical protein ABFD62_12625 [Syntrophaceae bacterium]